MKAYLTRLSGTTPRYMITRFKPIICMVEGSSDKNAFFQPGDPLGIPGNPSLCNMIRTVCGITKELDELETVRVEISGKEIPMK